jgi:hypothetical protein
MNGVLDQAVCCHKWCVLWPGGFQTDMTYVQKVEYWIQRSIVYAFIAVEPLIKMWFCGLHWSCLRIMGIESGEEIPDCQSRKTLKYGCEAHKTWNQEWLCRWGSAAVCIPQLTQRARAENSLMIHSEWWDRIIYLWVWRGPDRRVTVLAKSAAVYPTERGMKNAGTSSSVPDLKYEPSSIEVIGRIHIMGGHNQATSM